MAVRLGLTRAIPQFRQPLSRFYGTLNNKDVCHCGAEIPDMSPMIDLLKKDCFQQFFQKNSCVYNGSLNFEKPNCKFELELSRVFRSATIAAQWEKLPQEPMKKELSEYDKEMSSQFPEKIVVNNEKLSFEEFRQQHVCTFEHFIESPISKELNGNDIGKIKNAYEDYCMSKYLRYITLKVIQR